MRPRTCVVLTLLLLLGCTGDQPIGRRYEAERALWKMDQQRRDLPGSARPGSSAWRAMALRYEGLAQRYQAAASPDSGGAPVEAVAASAWLRAVDIYCDLFDSTRANQLLVQMAQDFQADPAVSARVALRQGTIAESEGQFSAAIEHYERVVQQVGPDSGAGAAADSVMSLPLRIARLTALVGPSAQTRDAYAQARDYYRRFLGADSLRTRVSATTGLAQALGELGRWQRSLALLDSLEASLKRRKQPPMDPAQVRLLALKLQIRALDRGRGQADSLDAQLDSLEADYPDSPAVPEALWAMAHGALGRGERFEAVRYLDRLRNHYGDDPLVPESMLRKAHILETLQQWPKALFTLHLLQAESPLSSQALQVPLEIALHARRSGDEEAAAQALSQAEQQYRQFLARYPGGAHISVARERLAEVLELQGRTDEALEILLNLSRSASGARQELSLLVKAAALARRQLDDPDQAIQILQRIVTGFPNTRTAAWASTEIQRLRSASSS